MIVLVKLILAHLIGDFLLQPNAWVKEKEKTKLRSPKLYWHVAIHGLLVLLFLWDLKLWPLALAIVICHFFIDVLKLYLQKDNNKSIWFWVDQLLHILSILIIYGVWAKPEWHIAFILQNEAFWIGVTGIIFITVVAGVIIQVLMLEWSKDIHDNTDQSLKRAGKYIGILERLFIFIFILYGQWEAIGFLLAAKSIFRFGDLKEARDRKLTEYILIGTLLSFGIAIATSLIVQYWIQI